MDKKSSRLIVSVVLAALLQGCIITPSREKPSPTEEMQNAGRVGPTTAPDGSMVTVYRSPT